MGGRDSRSVPRSRESRFATSVENFTRQEELILRTVRVFDLGQPVRGPRGVVYSCHPTRAPTATRDHFLKGPELNVLVPEVIAHLLARMVGLAVPQFGVALWGDKVYFASEEVQNQNVGAWVKRKAIANPQVMLEAVVFDIWLANQDRNLGNFVGEVDQTSHKMHLYAIDFEKSLTLRGPHPITSVPTVDPRKFWPRDELGRLLRGERPPTYFCERISAIPRNGIEVCFDKLMAHIGRVPWSENSVKVLTDRARNLRKHLQEAWI
jgi:hypothetical protein